jgi:hypothetical protein
MPNRNESDDALTAWLQIPEAIEKAIEGLTDEDLNLRGGPDDWSIRETVHHLVEANLVASNLVIAGLARSGCTYDWSWVTPDGPWMQRIGYNTASVRPAIATLQALCPYLSELIRASSDARSREVRLLDAPGAELRTVTIEAVLRDEVEHAHGHLKDIAGIRTKLNVP